MTPTSSGYYWAYTLDREGLPLESADDPSIVWYCDQDRSLQIMGFNFTVDYRADNYKLLERLKYSPLIPGVSNGGQLQ